MAARVHSRQALLWRFTKEVTARLSLFGWGLHHKAGFQVVKLILSGALDRHPDLTIISGHWGEMVPFFLQRLDDMIPQGATGLRRTITQTFRDQVWMMPSGMLNMPHFNFLRETPGYERILFSVDYPYLTMTGARSWLENLPVPEEERLAIASGNAKKLFRLQHRLLEQISCGCSASQVAYGMFFPRKTCTERYFRFTVTGDLL